MDLEVPRDRAGAFEPVPVTKGTRRLPDFDEMVISLYVKGMTTPDIVEHLQLTYGASVSHETIATITDVINEQSRPGATGRWTRCIRSFTSTRSGCGPVTAPRCDQRPGTWPSGSTSNGTGDVERGHRRGRLWNRKLGPSCGCQAAGLLPVQERGQIRNASEILGEGLMIAHPDLEPLLEQLDQFQNAGEVDHPWVQQEVLVRR